MLFVAVALARLLCWLSVPVLYVLRFLIIVRGVALLALTLAAQALWDLRWAFALAGMLAAVLLVTGCSRPAESVARTNGGDVARLFTVDGCTVYRFRDAGDPHWFTNCPGQVLEEPPRDDSQVMHGGRPGQAKR